METMLRHWTLLRTLSRAPRKLEAHTLTDRLREEGFDVSKRTVERDLRKLSAAFPRTNHEAPVSCGWFWPRCAVHPSGGATMDREFCLGVAVLGSPDQGGYGRYRRRLPWTGRGMTALRTAA